jgi:hypothetical protein
VLDAREAALAADTARPAAEAAVADERADERLLVKACDADATVSERAEGERAWAASWAHLESETRRGPCGVGGVVTVSLLGTRCHVGILESRRFLRVLEPDSRELPAQDEQDEADEKDEEDA